MLTQGLTGGCSNSCAGGVDRIAIANKADIASITVDANGNAIKKMRAMRGAGMI